jgi:Microtubule-binding calmodulin-regulated spectrin-associated
VLRFATLRGLQLHLLSVLGDLWRTNSSTTNATTATAASAAADQVTATKPASPLAVTSLLEGQSLDKEFIALSVIVAALETPSSTGATSSSSSAIGSAAALNRAALAERVAAMRKSEKAAAIRVKRREIEALRRELRSSFTDTVTPATDATTAAAAADTDDHSTTTAAATAGASTPTAGTLEVEQTDVSSTAAASNGSGGAQSSSSTGAVVHNQRTALESFLARPAAASAASSHKIPGVWAKKPIIAAEQTAHSTAKLVTGTDSWHDSNTAAAIYTQRTTAPAAAVERVAAAASTNRVPNVAHGEQRIQGLWSKQPAAAAERSKQNTAEIAAAGADSWHDSSSDTATRDQRAAAATGAAVKHTASSADAAATSSYRRVPGVWTRAPARARSPPAARAQTAENSKSDAPLWCSDLPPRPRTAATSPRTSSDEGHNSSSSAGGRVNSSAAAVPAAVRRSADSKLRLSGSRNSNGSGSGSGRLMAAPMHAAGLYESFDEQQHLAERPEDTALLRATQEDLQSYGMRAYAALRNRALLDDSSSSSYEHSSSSLSASQPNGLQRLLAADTSNGSDYSDVRASLGASSSAVEPKRRQRVPSFAAGALARISNSYLNSEHSAAVHGGTSSARPASARSITTAVSEQAAQQLSSARSTDGSSSVTNVEPFVEPLISPKQQQQQQRRHDDAVLLQDIDAAELQELKAAVSPQYSSAAAANSFGLQRSTSPVTTATNSNTAAAAGTVNPWAVHSSATVRLSGGLAEQALTALLSPKSARSGTAFDSRSPLLSPKHTAATVAAAAAAAEVPEVDTDYYDSGADEDTAAVLQASRITTSSSNGHRKPLAQSLDPLLQHSPPSPIESPLHSGRFARGFFLDGDNLTTWGTGASPSDHASDDAGSDFADYDTAATATAAASNAGAGATAGAGRVRSKLSAEEVVPATARSDGCSDECSAASDDSGGLHSRQLTRSVSPVLVDTSSNSSAQQHQRSAVAAAAAVQHNYADICVEDSLTEFPLLPQQQQQQHRAAAVGNVWQSADAWAALGLTDTTAAGESPTVEAEGSLPVRAKPPREDLLVRMEVQRARELIEQQRRASGQRVTSARARVTVEALKRIKVVAAAADAVLTATATAAATGVSAADDSADVSAGDTPQRGTPRTRPLRGWHTLKPTPLRVPAHAAAQQHQHNLISNSSSINISSSNNSNGRLQNSGQGASKAAVRPPPPPPPRRSLRDATSAVRASAEFLLHANADADATAADSDENDELIDSLAGVEESEPAVAAVASQQQQQQHQQRQQYLRSRFGWKAAAGDSSSSNSDAQQQQQQFSATSTAPAYTTSPPTHRTYAQARSSSAAVAAAPLQDRYSAAAGESYDDHDDVIDTYATDANGGQDALFSDGCYAEDSLQHYADNDSIQHDHCSNDYYSSTAAAAAAAAAEFDNNGSSDHADGASPRGESPVSSPLQSPRAPLRFDISASSSSSAAIAGALQQQQQPSSAERAASRAVRGAKFEARRAQKAAEMEQRRLAREDRQAAARQARLQAAAAERAWQAQAQAQLLEEAGLLADSDAPQVAASASSRAANAARSRSPERQYSSRQQQQQQQQQGGAHCEADSTAADAALQLLPLQVHPFQRGSSAQSSRSRATPHHNGEHSSSYGCSGPPSVRAQQSVIAGASNRKLIRNAIMHLCLAGAHLETQKARCIDALDAHPAMR